MNEDQQFCLTWNDHHSTLISVFDKLLENGTLVDCTLAAEGQFLKAHKVVLSACSPYFASLVAQQYDKHPIFILKDVKFVELKAMLNYMYRGEVNISQDQLASLLKAAESLQIKGLSYSRDGGGGCSNVETTSGGQTQSINEYKQLSVSVTVPTKSSGVSSGYTLDQKRPRHAIGTLSMDSRKLEVSREGSFSPITRKRKKTRRMSFDNIMADNHDHSNSSSHAMQVNSSTVLLNTSAATGAAASVSSTPTTAASISGNVSLSISKKIDNLKMESDVEEDLDNDGGVYHRDQQHQENNKPIVQLKKEQNHKRKLQLDDTNNGKDTPNSDLLINLKHKYDDGHEETVEHLTLEEEELLENLEQAEPSHGGEGSSQKYAQWQVNRSQHDVFLAAQEAAGQQRDSQAIIIECIEELDDQLMYEIVSEEINDEDAEASCEKEDIICEEQGNNDGNEMDERQEVYMIKEDGTEIERKTKNAPSSDVKKWDTDKNQLTVTKRSGKAKTFKNPTVTSIPSTKQHGELIDVDVQKCKKMAELLAVVNIISNKKAFKKGKRTKPS